jgi:hypothetical protein
VRPSDRATEFKQRCEGLAIAGVTLHSYRYSWAERALQCGYPERFAQQALGHNSKAVHHAYAKRAEVTVPSLEDWEKQWKRRLEDGGRRTEGRDQKSEVRSQEAEAAMPKLVPVDFQVREMGTGSAGRELEVGAVARG